MSLEIIAKWLSRPIKSFAVTEVSDLSVTIGTTVGSVREENQDRVVAARFTSAKRPETSFISFAICDGMGGMADGSRCAEIALSAFLMQLAKGATTSAGDAVRLAAMEANAEVNRRYRERGGTTIVAMAMFPKSAAAVSVGDSRLYEIVRPGSLRQISSDDTIVGELNKLPGFAPPHSASDTFAGQLAQYVGLGDGVEPRVHRLDRSNAYLLTSDGVHGYGMSPETLNQFVAAAGPSSSLVSRLLQLSRWCGGRDNASIICASPLDASHPTPLPWGEDDWLEIWDCGGKIEFPLTRADRPAAAETRPPERLPRRSETPTETSRKRGQGSSPKRSRPSDRQRRVTPDQGSLKIEIVGEADVEAAGGAEAPPTGGRPDKALANEEPGSKG